MFTRSLLPAHAWALAALLVLAGCSRQHSNTSLSDAPEAGTARLIGPDLGSPSGVPGRGGSFYPLAIGNQWDYTIRARTTLVTDAGAQPPSLIEFPWEVSITGMLHATRRGYFIQQESDPRLAAPSSMFLLREDRSGLYLMEGVMPLETATRATPSAAAQWRSRVDDVLAVAPHAAAFARAADAISARLELAAGGGLRRHKGGGPDPGELSFLRYPLRPGARWVVRDVPRFTRTVVARETLRLLAGTFDTWKLRGDSELFGSADRVHFWYAHAGLVRIRFHIEADATDETGAVVGRMVVDQDQFLTSLSLHRPNDPHTLGH